MDDPTLLDRFCEPCTRAVGVCVWTLAQPSLAVRLGWPVRTRTAWNNEGVSDNQTNTEHID